ncbi:formamidopyrimidine-DNA glycosylase [Streptomyces sp. LamerLS-316]|uniref:Fpg/Nei family DNA glycosylase n=1 Tax=unclassified Streptomyces TaxID=2593676 RepID=UPI000823770D|nr:MULTISPECIES: DNA-formamidopyrimidine glycosylase family protein [unclassified Streptomyces]MYQ37693.1 Fpg/Nei family DNA glycosylase [Streptomyces sp. SID4921]SCK46106.1 formamidopyrimidine-DNA glycosylase [Streptomyces sp. LamerLS-316]
MPELPDVEGFRRELTSCGRQRKVTDVDVRDSGVLEGVSGRRLRGELTGSRFGTPRRRGKWLLAPTDDGPTLAWHFGMTGSLRCCSPEEEIHRHDRLVLTLDDGRQVRYRDQRKLKGVSWMSDHDRDRLLDGLGPDALTVGTAEFEEALSRRRSAVKSALMDQSLVAGLGNLLCDEILWRARVDPRTPARDLDAATLRRVHGAMGRVLRTSVRAGHVPTRRSWLTGRRDASEPSCPRCGHALESDRVAGRRTVHCPHCQTGQS